MIKIIFLSIGILMWSCENDPKTEVKDVLPIQKDTLIITSGIFVLFPNSEERSALKQKHGDDLFYTLVDDVNFYLAEISNQTKLKVFHPKFSILNFKNENYILDKSDFENKWLLIEYTVGQKPKIFSPVEYYQKTSKKKALSTLQWKDFTGKDGYLFFTFDLNSDGLNDKIVSQAPFQGDQLFVFLNDDKGQYDLLAQTFNFSIDGGNQIKTIRQSKNGFVIVTYFPDRGYLENEYFIEQIGGNLVLSKIIYKTSSWQDDYTQTLVCEVKQHALLQGYDNIPIQEMPSESEREKACRIEFQFESSLALFIERFSEKNARFINDIKRYEALLIKFPLRETNMTEYNDIAYFLGQSGNLKEAIFLLEKIILKSPNRTVAYLNLADVCWELNEKEKATKNYKKYIDLMKRQGKDLNKIPERVNSRIEEN